MWTVPRPTKREDRGTICYHLVHLTDWSKGHKMRWIISTCLAKMCPVDIARHTVLWGHGLETGTCDYCSRDWTPILAEPQEREKTKPSRPLPVGSCKTCRTGLAGIKSAGRIFFQTKTKDLELWENQTRIQKEVRRQIQAAEANFTSLSFRTCISFYFSSFHLVFLFCFFVFIVWFVFYSPFHITFYFFFLHFYSKKQTTLGFIFYSFYSDYIFLITLFGFQIPHRTLPWS